MKLVSPRRLIGAAIVMIAVFILPGAAFAHGDAADHQPEVSVAAGPYYDAQQADADLAAAMDQAVPARPSNEPCGHCCGGSMVNCCLSVLSTLTVAPAHLPGASGRLQMAQDREPDSRASEALPRPPRSFA